MKRQRQIRRFAAVLIAVFCGIIIPRGLFHGHHHHHDHGDGIVANDHDHHCAVCDHYFSSHYISGESVEFDLSHEINSEFIDQTYATVIRTEQRRSARAPPVLL